MRTHNYHDLDGNLRMLLRTPPPPHGTPGNRKAAPEPPPKPKPKKKRRHLAPAPEPTQAALAAQDKARRERLTKGLTAGAKRKAAQKEKKR